MLRKPVSIGLFMLLLCHTLASAIVGMIGWWRAENDLSERLQVFRSVDSIVEFQVPLIGQSDSGITHTTRDGFSYRGHYYTVISLEIKGDTLHIAGLETKRPSMWQDDLFAFLNDHLTTTPDSGKKTSQLLKLLLKEYSPGTSSSFCFLRTFWHYSVLIPEAPFTYRTFAASIPSPPPERA